MATLKTITVPVQVSGSGGGAHSHSGVVTNSPNFTVLEMSEAVFDQLVAAQDRIEALERDVQWLRGLVVEMAAYEKAERIARFMEEARR